MKTWTVTITAEFKYTEDEHGEWITSVDDARQDAIDWLVSMGASPDSFEIDVYEGEVEDE